jgi:hypothetical protein
MTEYRQPLFGRDGEPCGSCGAALASDQRYCLACGARRGEARLPFRDILSGQSPGSTELLQLGAPVGPGYSIAAPPPAGTINDRLRRNGPLMALVGILLLALLIGVLLGHWAGDNGAPVAAAAPRPQIIQVGSSAPAAAAATTPAATTTPTAATTDTTATSSTTSTTAADAGGSTTSAGSGGSNSAVKKLQNSSGAAYQKQVDKLGKTIATGGKAPPKDNKPAGGGSSSQDIG